MATQSVGLIGFRLKGIWVSWLLVFGFGSVLAQLPEPANGMQCSELATSGLQLHSCRGLANALSGALTGGRTRNMLDHVCA